jgi:hypothetical protein
MGMTGIAKIVTQKISHKKSNQLGSCLGLNKWAEIFSEFINNVSVELTFQHQGLFILGVKSLVDIDLIDLYMIKKSSTGSYK